MPQFKMQLLTPLLLFWMFFSNLAAAFYPYIPSGQHGASKSMRVTSKIAEGFNGGLSRVSLHKRAVPVS